MLFRPDSLFFFAYVLFLLFSDPHVLMNKHFSHPRRRTFTLCMSFSSWICFFPPRPLCARSGYVTSENMLVIYKNGFFFPTFSFCHFSSVEITTTAVPVGEQRRKISSIQPKWAALSVPHCGFVSFERYSGNYFDRIEWMWMSRCTERKAGDEEVELKQNFRRAQYFNQCGANIFKIKNVNEERNCCRDRSKKLMIRFFVSTWRSSCSNQI